MQLVTHQTGPSGQKSPAAVDRGWIGDRSVRALPIGLVLDRATAKLCSSCVAGGRHGDREGGEGDSDLIYKETIEPALRLQPYQRGGWPSSWGWEKKQINQAVSFMIGLYKAYVEANASLMRSNPFITTRTEADGSDCKINFDDTRCSAQGPAGAARPGEEDPLEVQGVEVQPELHQAGRQHCVHGERAGWRWRRWTSSATRAEVRANFLDVGGSASQEADRECV